MCSFYNPNIQSKFDESKCLFPELKGGCLASIVVVCKKQGSNQQYVNLKNSSQHNLLAAWDSGFSEILADMILLVWSGDVKSFKDYIQEDKTLKISNDEFDRIYLTAKLIDFIELLFFSEFGDESSCCSKLNYESSLLLTRTGKDYGFYTVYERLQLYDYVFNHSHLEVSALKVGHDETELTLQIKIA